MSQHASRREFLKGSALAAIGLLRGRQKRLSPDALAQREAEHRHHRGAQPRGGQHGGRGEREHRRPVRRGRELPGRGRQEVSARPRPTSTGARCSTRRTSTRSSSARPTTPTPWPASWAMKRGKHVYCEKPLAHSVYEARVMRETCKQDEGGHPDGHADPRQRQLPPRGRADSIGRDRAGARGARLGRAGHRRAAQPAGGNAAGSRRTCTGTSGWARRRGGPITPATSRSVPCPGRTGGISATARWATWAATSSTCRSGRWSCSIPRRSRPRGRCRCAPRRIPSG